MSSDITDINAARIDRDLQMRGSTPDYAVQSQFTAAQAATQIRELQLGAQRLRELEGSPMWAQFQHKVKTYKADMLKALYSANDPTTLAKRAGALEAVALFENWVAEEIESISANVEQIKAEQAIDSEK